MSPEQARAQNLDGRSDLYSLGVVGYQCLTGHVPFDGEDSFSIGYKHIMEELPTPPLENADQREMFSVIQKMMAKKPEDRYQTAEDVVHVLEAIGGASGPSMQDLATMPTRAIEPMKAPAPAMSIAATTPLPRASASMMKKPEEPGVGPAGAAAVPPKAGPPAKPAARPVPKPAPKPKSKAPFYALAAVVVVGAGLGAYVMFFRGAPQVAVLPDTTAVAAQTPQTPDTAKLRADSAAAAAAAAAARPNTTSTAGREPVRGPVQPRGPDGTLSLAGNIPANARITVDGRRTTSLREKLSPGRHRLRVEAAGFQPFEAQVDIRSGGTLPYTVQMQAVTAAVTTIPTTTTPTTTPASTGPAANCSSMQAGQRNVGNACYDVRPRPRGLPAIAPPASCTGNVTPANVLLQVSAAGDVLQAFAQGRSNCAAFNDQAVAFARDMGFQPATKGGQPVPAWIILPIQARR
jgi:hypothetical protein